MSSKKRATREKSGGSSAATSPSSSMSSSMNVSGSYNSNNMNNNVSNSGRGNASKAIYRNSPQCKSDSDCNMFVQLSYAAPQHIVGNTANTTNKTNKHTEEISSQSNICFLANSNEYNRWCGRGWNKNTDDIRWKATEEWYNTPLSKSLARKVMTNVFDQRVNFEDTTTISTTNILRDESLAFDCKVNAKNSILTRRSLRENWWQYVVQEIGSSALYPHHVICWHAYNESAQVNIESKLYERARFTARLITNIIHTYTHWCTYVDEYKTNDYVSDDNTTITSNINNNKSKECESNTHNAPTVHDNHDYVYLLNHSLQCTGYAAPQVELPDVTLSTTIMTPTHSVNITEECEVKQIQQELELNKIRLQLICNMHTAHINVCCGMFYYKLTVYDVIQGRMKSVREIADALVWIAHDAKKRFNNLRSLQISDNDKAELMSLYTLLSQLSCVIDSVKVDVMRRLRSVSKVNAYALDMLDAALFTVVIEMDDMEICCTKHSMLQRDTNTAHLDSDNIKECAYHSQWLHNALSLYVRSPRSKPSSSSSSSISTTLATTISSKIDTEENNNILYEGNTTEVELRAHATLISMNTLQRFAHDVMELSYRNNSNEEEEYKRKENTIDNTKKTPMTSAANLQISTDINENNYEECQNNSNKSSNDESNKIILERAKHDDVEYLEMWLPERQRFPLRPYLQTLQPIYSSGNKCNEANHNLFANNFVSTCVLEQSLHRQREQSSHIAQLRAMRSIANTCLPPPPPPPPTTTTTTTTVKANVNFAQFCLRVIRTVHHMYMHKKERSTVSEDEIRVPRVCFASQNANSTVPSIIHLWGREIENYLRVCNSPSVLIDQRVRDKVQTAALERISKLIDECVYSSCSLHFASFISEHACTEKSKQQERGAHATESIADVCITASLLSLPFLNSRLHTGTKESHVDHPCNVNYALSKLRLCANVHLYCSLCQVRAQKRICYSDAAVHHLEMQSISNSDADTFAQAFHSCA